MIETERLLLRDSEKRDREPFARLNSDPRVMEFMPARLSPVGKAISWLIASRGILARMDLACMRSRLRQERAFIGFAGFSIPAFKAHFTPCVEIGWRLAAEYWGRGLATEAASAVVRYAFESLALDALVSFTVPANIRSRRVMEKVGMTHDPADDFDHPQLVEGHPLRRHVLYRLRRSI